MGARPEAGNNHLLVLADRASKYLFAFPPPNKTAEKLAKNLLELLLTFGIPLSLRVEPGTEFTADVIQHLLMWFNMTIDYGSSDHPRAQRAVQRLGSGSMKPSSTFVKTGLGDSLNMCSQHSGSIERHPIHFCQAKPPRFSNYLVVTAVPIWALPHQAPTMRAWKDCITSTVSKRYLRGLQEWGRCCVMKRRRGAFSSWSVRLPGLLVHTSISL